MYGQPRPGRLHRENSSSSLIPTPAMSLTISTLFPLHVFMKASKGVPQMMILFPIGFLLVSLLAVRVGHTFEPNLIPRCSMKKYALFSMLFVFLLSFTGESSAQFAQRGGMQGAVADPSGALIPGANVTLVQLGQNQTRQITADAHGHYEFDNLVAGQYLLTVTAQ